MTDISERGADFVRDLGQAARNNPLSAALIGMGVLWLFTGNRPVERAGDFVRSGFDRMPDAAGNMYEAARSTVKSSADTVAGGIASATETLRDGGAAALDGAARFGDFGLGAGRRIGQQRGVGRDAGRASGKIKPTPRPNTANPCGSPGLRCSTRFVPT